MEAWPRRWPLVGALLEKRWRGEVLRDLDFALAWLDRADNESSSVRSPASGPPGR